jgi:hypothetical protein
MSKQVNNFISHKSLGSFVYIDGDIQTILIFISREFVATLFAKHVLRQRVQQRDICKDKKCVNDAFFNVRSTSKKLFN